MNRYSKILIANRGEIAVRVIRTAKALGYRTVAVFSEADAEALHVQLADQAVCVGPAPVGESYLQIDNILEAAEKSGADAVHPGYGFLSENTVFAQRCAEKNITFIGPSAEAIELMGNKRLAKIRMLEANVPCIPGYEGSDQSDATLISEIQKIGLPVMVKAAAGGGGRGMRLVTDENDIENAIQSARSEALNAFGSDELILEKAVMQPRHVEIQVFGDEHGNHIHLGERDCSIQRRHQKVVEESPSPAVTPTIRDAMGQAAVEAAKAIHYTGAGTVEFLLDQEGHFYFLEMNTRLQVEHPVTEEVTGIDLVEWQLRVAQGEALPLTQDDIRFTGHAIEVRLYAEDPYNQFLPQTGTVLQWHIPTQPGLRVDHCVQTGQQISPFYDPMIAKVIVHGPDRETARRKLIVALEDMVLHGVQTNKDFLVDIVAHPNFAKGEATTAFIGEYYPAEELQAPSPESKMLALAALAFYYRDIRTFHSHQPADAAGWINAATDPINLLLQHGEAPYPVTIRVHRAHHFTVHADGQTHEIIMNSADQNALTFVLDNVLETARYLINDSQSLYLDYSGRSIHLVDQTLAPEKPRDDALDGIIRAPMDGRILSVNCAAGRTVDKGQILFILEAMKMEHQIKSSVDGTLSELSVSEGEQVTIRQVLADIAVTETTEAEEA